MYIGIDLGGTTCRVSSFPEVSGYTTIEHREFGVSQVGGSPTAAQLELKFLTDFSQLKVICNELSEQHGPIEGIGIAAAGVISRERTHIKAAGNIRHWVKRPVVAELVREFNCPVVLGNDAESAAMAEALYGLGQETDFWFVIWGTGVGGTLLRRVSGQPVPFAGELGHQCIDDESSLKCGCGQTGCLEAFAGGINIEKRYGIHPSELDADQWHEVLSRMKTGVHNAVALQPVPRVVFGGGIACKQSHLLPKLESDLRAELQIVDGPDVRLSLFGESAGTVGALALLDLVSGK